MLSHLISLRIHHHSIQGPLPSFPLRMGKPLIVVVNEDLMDNHQSELAEELAERQHLLCAHPQTLHQVIKSMDLESLIPYPPADATPVAKHINRFLGFPDD